MHKLFRGNLKHLADATDLVLSWFIQGFEKHCCISCKDKNSLCSYQKESFKNKNNKCFQIDTYKFWGWQGQAQAAKADVVATLCTGHEPQCNEESLNEAERQHVSNRRNLLFSGPSETHCFQEEGH